MKNRQLAISLVEGKISKELTERICNEFKKDEKKDNVLLEQKKDKFSDYTEWVQELNNRFKGIYSLSTPQDQTGKIVVHDKPQGTQIAEFDKKANDGWIIQASEK